MAGSGRCPLVFSGSYAPEDVRFLLKPAEIPPTPVAEKERLLQGGIRHYSELLAPEFPPSVAYMTLYEDALQRNGVRLAHHLVELAKQICSTVSPPTLISLARAGTPIGVLLRRTLLLLGVEAPHYSVSIIRDRGLDFMAMDYVLQRHSASSIVFVDGWTGKGAIQKELVQTLRTYTRERGVRVLPRLAVIADLAGCSTLAATTEDYLIPCAILNAVVSGLISRTVLNEEVVGPGDYHACAFYEKWRNIDVSRQFVDVMSGHIRNALDDKRPQPASTGDKLLREQHQLCKTVLSETMRRYGIGDANRVKPGIGETTRAVLRRVPERIILRDPTHTDVQHIVYLANTRHVPIEHRPDFPLNALAVIRRTSL